jgi:hypothetical protein
MSPLSLEMLKKWLRGRDLNPRPLGYEPNELPDCSTPRHVTEAKFMVARACLIHQETLRWPRHLHTNLT